MGTGGKKEQEEEEKEVGTLQEQKQQRSWRPMYPETNAKIVRKAAEAKREPWKRPCLTPSGEANPVRP